MEFIPVEYEKDYRTALRIDQRKRSENTTISKTSEMGSSIFFIAQTTVSDGREEKEKVAYVGI